MAERDFLVDKICDRISQMDLRMLRMVWAYVRKLGG